MGTKFRMQLVLGQGLDEFWHIEWPDLFFHILTARLDVGDDHKVKQLKAQLLELQNVLDQTQDQGKILEKQLAQAKEEVGS